MPYDARGGHYVASHSEHMRAGRQMPKVNLFTITPPSGQIAFDNGQFWARGKRADSGYAHWEGVAWFLNMALLKKQPLPVWACAIIGDNLTIGRGGSIYGLEAFLNYTPEARARFEALLAIASNPALPDFMGGYILGAVVYLPQVDCLPDSNEQMEAYSEAYREDLQDYLDRGAF